MAEDSEIIQALLKVFLGGLKTPYKNIHVRSKTKTRKKKKK